MIRTITILLVLATTTIITYADNNNVNVLQTSTPLHVDGLVAATFTPFDADFKIDTSMVQEQAAYLNATGVKYVFVSGTTGESVKLSTTERLSQAKLWVQLAKQYNLKTIIHVGADCLEDAKMMASNAVEIGADAVAAMPPSFFKPATIPALVAFMSAIANEASSLPFYYYHIPSMDGVIFPMFDFVSGMNENGAKNFAGVKYTGLYQYPGFMDAARILGGFNGKYEVLCGRDEMMIEALAAGIKGFVGSQYNFAGDVYNQIREAFGKNDLSTARKIQLNAINLLQVGASSLGKAQNGMKAIMNLAVKVGEARLPNLPLDDGMKSTIKTGVQNWCTNEGNAISAKICSEL